MSKKTKRNREEEDISSKVIGSIDTGGGLHYPDIAYSWPAPPTFQCRGVLVLTNCFASAIERYFQCNTQWSIVDNIDEHTIMMQARPAQTVWLSIGPKPGIVTQNESGEPPHGKQWLHGTTPADQHSLRSLYGELLSAMPQDGHHNEKIEVYLAVCIHPLKLVHVKW